MIASVTGAGVLATIADLLVALLALAIGGLGVKIRDLAARLDALEEKLELRSPLSAAATSRKGEA